MIILSCSAPRMNSSPLPSPLSESPNMHKCHSERKRRSSHFLPLTKTRSFGYRLRMTLGRGLRGEGEYFSPPRSRSEFFPRPFRERARVRVLIWLMLTLVIWPPVALGQVVKSLETVSMTVSDMDRSVEFFSKVLSFEQVSDVEVHGAEYEKLQDVFGVRMRVVRMKLGEEMIELTQYLAPEGRPIPSDSRSNNHWFQHIAVVVGDMDKAYQQLRAHKVRHASTGPQTIPASNKAAAGILTLAGESLNHGTEQEHLNNVAGARLHISGLRAASGPGIEFLEYLTPRDGRPAPKDTRANDLWHWQTTLSTTSAEAVARKLNGGRARMISRGVAAIADKNFAFTKGFLARDPDGHGLQFIEN